MNEMQEQLYMLKKKKKTKNGLNAQVIIQLIRVILHDKRKDL